MIRDVLRMGDPRLLQRSAPVDAFGNPALDALLADMRETMVAKKGAGLAAPQIGVLQQVVIFGVERNERYPDAEPVPYTELVNPVLTPLSDERDEDWEGCLSIPDIRGMVPRFTDVTVRALDRNGKKIELRLKNFAARVAQHETDHLDGVLFFDRMTSMQSLTFLEEYSRFHSKDED